MSIDKTTITEINDMVLKYSEELSSYGVKCTVNQKHFQIHSSHEPHTNANAGIFFAMLDKAKHKLRLKFLPYKDDDYKCIVIKFEPVNSSIKKAHIKEYAFISSYSEDIKTPKDSSSNIPDKAERLIKKTIKKLNRTSADKVCKDTIFDIFRYTTQIKYFYKKQILGINKSYLDTAISLFFLLIFLCVIALIFM